MRQILAAVVAILALAATEVTANAAQPIYHIARSIPLPDGRWDLLSVKAGGRRIAIGRGDSVTLVDLKTDVAKTVGSVARGHAAVLIGGTDMVAVTSGGDDSVRLIDATTGHQTARIAVGKNPDAAIYDSASKRLIVMNAEDGSVSVIDPHSARVVKTVPVKPALELGALIAPNLLAVNDEDAGEIELVDLKRGAALPAIPLTGCEGPTGIAFDQRDGLLLSACANGHAALVDSRSRRLIALLPIGEGPDGALFDAQRRRFLVPCGRSGTLSVFAVNQRGQVTPLAVVPTEIGARTAALDTGSGRIYLPTARFEPAPAGGRPRAVAGSVHLIVLEPASDN